MLALVRPRAATSIRSGYKHATSSSRRVGYRGFGGEDAGLPTWWRQGGEEERRRGGEAERRRGGPRGREEQRRTRRRGRGRGVKGGGGGGRGGGESRNQNGNERTQ